MSRRSNLALARAEPTFDVDPSPLDRAHQRLLAGLRHGEAADWLSTRYRARSDLLVFDPARDYIAVCRHPGCARYADNSLCSAHREQAAAKIALEPGLTDEQWIARSEPAVPQAEYELPRQPDPCRFAHADGQECRRCGYYRGLCSVHYLATQRLRDDPDCLSAYAEAARPLGAQAACAVAACRWEGARRAGGRLLCPSHEGAWRNHGATWPSFDAWQKNQPPAGLSTTIAIWTGALCPQLLVELLWWCVACRDRRKLHTGRVNAMLAVARRAGVDTLLELEPWLAKPMLRADHEILRHRLELALADPEREWDRDVIRLAVVAPGFTGNIDLTHISQPWLRDAAAQWLRLRLSRTSPTQRARAGTGQYHAGVKGAVALSRSLATRADGGKSPGKLAEADIVSFVSLALKSDGDDAGLRTVERVRALLNDFRDNDLARSLRPSFAIQAHHLPDRTKAVSRSDGESALPDSTFAFLCGYDDLLGERTLDLLAAMPRLGSVDLGFAARELTALIRMAASFGRRPAELLALTCDRLRPGDRGGASVVYDNLKGARDAVPLPIDQVSAAEAAAWVREVRERWPETPIEELCWFARFRANDGGRRPLAVNYIGTLFRDWTQFLDQAIVVAKLHSLTGLPAELIVELPAACVTAHGLLAPDATAHALSPATRVGLCDYRADWPAVDASGRLFPLPRSWAHRRRVATPLDRFAALGPDWLSIAARYASFGMPGDDLGRARARVRDVQFRRFRHTYLQHLVDLGTDIFIVQELADHSSVQTTIEAYVTPRVAQLRAAVDKLSEYRIDRHGRRLAGDEVRLPSTSDVLTNACSNPQVSSLNKEGCPNGRRCQSCDFLSVDPSHRDEIRAEILTLRKSVQHFEDLDQPERAAMAAEDLDAWRAVLAEVDALLGGLDPGERQVAENAIKAVRAMRNRMRNSSLPLGVTLEGQGL